MLNSSIIIQVQHHPGDGQIFPSGCSENSMRYLHKLYPNFACQPFLFLLLHYSLMVVKLVVLCVDGLGHDFLEEVKASYLL